MKKHIILSVALITVLPIFVQAQDNAELLSMYNKDQSSRMQPNIDWAKLSKEDRAREQRLYQLLDSGKVTTAPDFYHAAMIFQHGPDTTASAMAVKMMRKAIELNPGMNKWLLAAAIDRHLMRRGEPQIYGTQYVRMNGEKWKRYNIDSTKVTDAQRREYGVESLAEQKIKEHRMNLLELYAYYKTGKSISEIIKHIQAEIKKGNNASYDVSEGGLNSFGYQLMAENKYDEALKIFELNAELFPKAFNTWDSLGECLLKLNRKPEAMKAYAKSLELNPGNGNARKILQEN